MQDGSIETEMHEGSPRLDETEVPSPTELLYGHDQQACTRTSCTSDVFASRPSAMLRGRPTSHTARTLHAVSLERDLYSKRDPTKKIHFIKMHCTSEDLASAHRDTYGVRPGRDALVMRPGRDIHAVR